MVHSLSDPQTDKATGKPVAAMCVRKSSARRVLQFTPINAASCVLHRPASQVIHRLQLCFRFDQKKIKTSVPTLLARFRRSQYHIGLFSVKKTSAPKPSGLGLCFCRTLGGINPDDKRPGQSTAEFKSADASFVRLSAPAARPGPTEKAKSLYSLMILPQVHLRKPCYDFYFL